MTASATLTGPRREPESGPVTAAGPRRNVIFVAVVLGMLLASGWPNVPTRPFRARSPRPLAAPGVRPTRPPGDAPTTRLRQPSPRQAPRRYPRR
ncbi:hypothetical protein ACGFK1_30060 [Mycobacterium sp. NPDC048908]|uniref:hypothetical protein n=1 Tax=Mycobacterium sp. NPDC048908 TaxID=3364292 RepID=UPI003711574E